jgi:hypothetical protein
MSYIYRTKGVKLMNVLDWTPQREKYQVSLDYSPLWEAALGIAAASWPAIHQSLDLPASYWKEVRNQLPSKTVFELEQVEKHNTWKGLLLLLHQRRFQGIEAFLSYLWEVGDEQLRLGVLPWLGNKREQLRQEAAKGDPDAGEALALSIEGKSFFPDYIRFVTQVDTGWLRKHLATVFQGWYGTLIQPEEERITGILERDMHTKKKQLEQMESEAWIEWSTGGLRYVPEPGVTEVRLIPQMVYRPWNIQASAKGMHIIYYPVADESLDERRDPYQPNSRLVRKLKALADEKRLGILKRLATGGKTLQELVRDTGIPKTTVHHHLTFLRSAYLVELKDNRYTFSQLAIQRGWEELQGFLGGRDRDC